MHGASLTALSFAAQAKVRADVTAVDLEGGVLLGAEYIPQLQRITGEHLDDEDSEALREVRDEGGAMGGAC